jgi:lysophospholipase L1-like esterase
MKPFLSIIFLPLLLSLSFQVEKPGIYVIGDSISIQYGPYLKAYLAGIATYDRLRDSGQALQDLDQAIGANGGDSRRVLGIVREKLEARQWAPDYLLLNCGLHDLRAHPGDQSIHQVEIKDYRQNLDTIISLLHRENIYVIWVRTTPVVDSIHNSLSSSFHRYLADVEAYNTVADQVMEQHGVPSVDLFTFTQQAGPGVFYDHAHFTRGFQKLQAAFIAGALSQIIVRD